MKDADLLLTACFQQAVCKRGERGVFSFPNKVLLISNVWCTSRACRHSVRVSVRVV